MPTENVADVFRTTHWETLVLCLWRKLQSKMHICLQSIHGYPLNSGANHWSAEEFQHVGVEAVNSELEWEIWRPGGAQCLIFQPRATFPIVLGYSSCAGASISYTSGLIFICTSREHQGWSWQLCILLKTRLLRNIYSTVVALYLYPIPLWVSFYFIVFYLCISPNYYYECIYQKKEGCSPLNLAGWQFCRCYF